MKRLLDIQQRNYKLHLKDGVNALDVRLKHQKIEERNLYNFLKYGFPVDKNVLFFDDAIENIDETNRHSRRIIPVYLPFDNSFIFKPMVKRHSFDALHKKYPKNTYLKRIYRNSLKRIYRNSDFTSSDGITNKYSTFTDEDLPSIEQRIYDWILNTQSYKKRYVFFDWDHTLNIYNGLKIFDTDTKTLNDTLLYALGGKERMKNIQNILDFLIKYDVKVYILTANPLAYSSKDDFVTLIQQLMGKSNFTHQQLIFVDIFKEPKYKAMHKIINSTKKRGAKHRSKTMKRKV